MNTFVPWALQAAADEEILESIIQSASVEMTPLHINQSLFILMEPSATRRLKAQSPLMNAHARVFALHSV